MRNLISKLDSGKTQREMGYVRASKPVKASKPLAEMTDAELDAVDPKTYGLGWRELGWDVRKWGFSDPSH